MSLGGSVYEFRWMSLGEETNECVNWLVIKYVIELSGVVSDFGVSLDG